MKDQILELAKDWANNAYFDAADRKEIQDLINANEHEELQERFYQDLEFGTGGLRSIIGMGRNRMNKYNVRKAAQAMSECILKEKPIGACVCISYDCRNFSLEFAKEVASVFAGNSIKAYIFRELTPTPILSYAIRYYKAHAGVMITASHNPKKYNGFKAYWSDGAQVTPPQDQIVIDCYYSIKNWDRINTLDFDKGTANGMIEWIGEELFNSYYQILLGHSLNPELCKVKGGDLKVIYTSLHGTGRNPCEKISKLLGFSSFQVLAEQAEFDGNFSTVETTPNPEDPRALSLAVNKMLQTGADLVYGTDPDCDRLGVAVNDNGNVHYLNGNQIAFLMLYYLCEEHTKKNTMPKNPLVIKSIVTSELQVTICRHYGVEVKNTLTGFKWMAMLWRELEVQQHYSYLFSSEESFGYMTHDKVRDKDAVGAIALMNEVALFYKLQGKNLIQVLDEIYNKFGYAKESLVSKTYEGITGKEKIDRIMEYFRTNHEYIADEKVEVFMDYKTLQSKDLSNGKVMPLEMESSNVLGLVFKDGNRLFLRPSGTEPKIKFYTMIQVSQGTLEQKKHKAQELIDKIELFIGNTIEAL